MADTDIDLPTSALWTLHEELGSWTQVSDFLQKYCQQSISVALVWKVAMGKSRSPRVMAALYGAGFLEHPRIVRQVIACPVCLKVHTQHKRCATYKRKDERITRAWHGSKEEAFELDDMLDSMGFSSLAQFVNAIMEDSRTEMDYGKNGQDPAIRIAIYR